MGIGICCSPNNTTTDDYQTQENYTPYKTRSAETFDTIGMKPLITKGDDSDVETVYDMSSEYLIPEELLADYERTRTMVSPQ